MPSNWEYKILSCSQENDEQREEKMNELGDEGWELVAVLPYETTSPDLYFKRRK